MQQELTNAVTDSKQSLLEIEDMQKAQKETGVAIMDEVMQNLESSFLSYGLTEDQEKLLLDIVRSGVDKSLDNFEQGMKVDEQMQTIISRLARFSSG